MFFKSSELAQRADCSTRTVYSFLREREAAGEIKVENKGRNGLLITMLKKGWELSQSFKLKFLAYFRDKGLIPYINTVNTNPTSAPPIPIPDRVDKMCAQEGLNESEIRAVKEKLKGVSEIKSLGGIVKYFIKQIKDGIMKGLKTSQEISEQKATIDRLRAKAELDAKTSMQIDGYVDPLTTGKLLSVSDLDAISEYNSKVSTRSVQIFNQLCLEAGLSRKAS
jgi:hypothetical protein